MPPAGARLDLDPAEFTNREKVLTGTVYGSGDPAEALPSLLADVAAGRVLLTPLVGPTFPLERADEAIQAALAGEPGRVIVTPRRCIMRREIRAPGVAEPISHYCDAVEANGLLFVSGCPATDEHGNLVGGDDTVAQCEQVLRNLGAILACRGLHARRTSSRSTSTSRTSTTAR